MLPTPNGNRKRKADDDVASTSTNQQVHKKYIKSESEEEEKQDLRPLLPQPQPQPQQNNHKQTNLDVGASMASRASGTAISLGLSANGSTTTSKMVNETIPLPPTPNQFWGGIKLSPFIQTVQSMDHTQNNKTEEDDEKSKEESGTTQTKMRKTCRTKSGKSVRRLSILEKLWQQREYETYWAPRAARVAFAILVGLYVFASPHVTDLGYLVFILSSTLIFLIGQATDCSSTGEKCLVSLLLFGICSSAHVINLAAGHPCIECVLAGPRALQGYAGGNNEQTWRHILHESDMPQNCAKCTLFALKVNPWINPLSEHNDRILYDDYENNNIDDDFKSTHAGGPMSPSELRKLDDWYDELKRKTLQNGKIEKLLSAVAVGFKTDGGQELFANITHGFLCYPASRMSGPRPSEFIALLEEPRFTGEEVRVGDGPMKVDFEETLLPIIRGDKMKQLPPEACAMIRLASQMPEDLTILNEQPSAARVAPIMTESQLRGVDGAFLFPGLFVPRVDEDKDTKGSQADLIEEVASLYIHLPIKDDSPIYFNKKEEYLAFFRWTIAQSVQDEFYFPKWLAKARGGDNDRIMSLVNESGELVADQFRFRQNRQRIFESTSDQTLSDRAFFGAGVKTLAQIKLPGDADYGYMTSPTIYATEGEADFFHNKEMPSASDLIRMGGTFWGTLTTLESLRKKVALGSLRKKVVQIDYTIASQWQYRDQFEGNGSILYLDAESRRPMGIFVSCKGRLFLPGDGPHWEYAKFVHRSTEIVVAAMFHLGEYHMGWSNTVSNAIRQTLPPTHGLRMLMKPHVHGTGAVNWVGYQILIRDSSMLARACGLTERHRGFAWGHIMKHASWQLTFPQLLDSKKLEGMSNLTETLPYFKQGKRLWEIHREYVEGFVSVIYPDDDDDDALENDDSLIHFWHYVNTMGRNIDPCVCGMDSEKFFKKDVWPNFEERRSCIGLLNAEKYETQTDDPIKRREQWCKGTVTTQRNGALYRWLHSECIGSHGCERISYEIEHMRADMGLPKMTRRGLIDLITRIIFEVTTGHEMVADTLPFVVDPSYGGCRRQKEYDINKPLMPDVSSWIFGASIGTFTSLRSLPLLADWSSLFRGWTENVADARRLSDSDRETRKQKLTDLHLKYKSDLVKNANQFMKESIGRPQNHWSPFLNPSTLAASIAI